MFRRKWLRFAFQEYQVSCSMRIIGDVEDKGGGISCEAFANNPQKRGWAWLRSYNSHRSGGRGAGNVFDLRENSKIKFLISRWIGLKKEGSKQGREIPNEAEVSAWTTGRLGTIHRGHDTWQNKRLIWNQNIGIECPALTWTTSLNFSKSLIFLSLI